MATECDNNRGFYPAVKGKKRRFAEELVSPEFNGNITELCNKYKINRSTYYRWKEDSNFNDYCAWLVEKYTSSELPRVWKAIIKSAVDKGDVQAQRLYLEATGRFTKKLDVSGNVGVVVISGEDELAD